MFCVVLGTIKIIEEEFGWFYLGCRDCTKKVISKEDYLTKVLEPTEELINAPAESLWCWDEQKQARSVVPKYE